MKRQVSLEEISDGKLYGRNDMVRAGCGGCRGCSRCCQGMGESILLDPCDAYRLEKGLGRPFGELLGNQVELHVVDGVILPNLRMNPVTDACGFLDGEGRCSVHPFRPGVCRLFPLGRYYREERPEAWNAPAAAEFQPDTRHSQAAPGQYPISFSYFLQVHECPAPNKTKVKVSRWIDLPDLPRYEAFVSAWHGFLTDMEVRLPLLGEEQEKNANLFLLKLFYLKPYDRAESFYPQFEARLQEAREVL